MVVPIRTRNNSTGKNGVMTAKGAKRICIPIDRDAYEQIVDDKDTFRQMLDEGIKQYPEIFPVDMKGYKLNGVLPPSKKMPDVKLRRIKLASEDAEGKARV